MVKERATTPKAVDPEPSVKVDPEKCKPAGHNIMKDIVIGCACVALFSWAIYESYRIRLYPVKIYGRLVHEFDPWFNYRAAQYLADNGSDAFWHWFDHRSWYPIGRPVGTTIYPAMQFTALYIWKGLKTAFAKSFFGENEFAGFAYNMSLKDITVFIPAWFSVISTVTTGLLTKEASGSWLAAAISAACMAIVPAHLMRTIAGVFDNECVAVPAMCVLFLLWCRSLRNKYSFPIAIFAGLAYAYMATSWGGYIFAGNLIAVHVGVLYLHGQRSPQLTWAYSLFWLFGTIPASFVPIVGMTPFTSLEQAAPMAVFFGLWILRICDYVEKFTKMGEEKGNKMRRYVVISCIALGCIVAVLGFFAPLSARVRSLFFTHTKTGNPLVDSVAEHQPASLSSYIYTLGTLFYLIPVGMAITAFEGAAIKSRELFGIPVVKRFILSYAAASLFFSMQMNRLLLLLGAVSAIFAGIALRSILLWSIDQVIMFFTPEEKKKTPNEKDKKKKKGNYDMTPEEIRKHPLTAYGLEDLIPVWKKIQDYYNSSEGRLIRVGLAIFLLIFNVFGAPKYWRMCDNRSRGMASPHIMMEATLRDGRHVIVRDYYDGYMWLKNNTPEDSRVLAWWDYGYHISGIAERISLADGNTWNLEHIATVGRMLASPEKKGWELARHMADYVLVWAGNTGDDLGKSPHIARISSSVYPDICPNDPLCFSFSFHPDGTPTKSMAESMLYKMHSHNVVPGVHVNPNYFQEVYTSQFGLLRIFKVLNISEESKAWCADPKNYACDRPGSWYCPGQYPPGFPAPPKTHRNIDYNKAVFMAAQRAKL